MAVLGRGRGGGTERKVKRNNGHGQQYGDGGGEGYKTDNC